MIKWLHDGCDKFFDYAGNVSLRSMSAFDLYVLSDLNILGTLEEK